MLKQDEHLIALNKVTDRLREVVQSLSGMPTKKTLEEEMGQLTKAVAALVAAEIKSREVLERIAVALEKRDAPRGLRVRSSAPLEPDDD